MHARTLAVLCLTPASLLASALGGPITPPAGPVAATYKTISQVQPRTPIGPDTTPGDEDSLFKITQSGSYYLTGNIAGISGKHGIEILAPDVTLDLMGFTLEGVDGSLSGIYAPYHVVSSGRPVVRSGAVRLWGGSGLSIDAARAVIEDVVVSLNGARGIDAGPYAQVSRCSATENATDGFFAATGSVLADCHADGNSGRGFSAGDSTVLRACRAENNAGEGFTLIAGGATLDGCVAHGNGADGASIGAGCLVTRSRFDSNRGNGLRLSTASRAVDCVATENDSHGITALDRCTLSGNTSDGNAASGIHLSGFHNRVQDNTVTSNAVGVSASHTGNLIAGNASLGNTTHYQIAPGNLVGQIRIGDGTITTGNPWANFGM